MRAGRQAGARSQGCSQVPAGVVLRAFTYRVGRTQLFDVLWELDLLDQVRLGQGSAAVHVSTGRMRPPHTPADTATVGSDYF